MNRHRISELRTMSMSRRGFFERLYEVHAGGELCATLSFDSVFGGGATGLFGGDSWIFKRSGFFATRIAVRKNTSEFDDAVFENRRWSSGGTVTFRDGRMYHAPARGWGKELQFLTESGEPVISFRPRGSFNISVEIEVARPSPDFPLLLLLGCYLVSMMLEESASAAAVAAMA